MGMLFFRVPAESSKATYRDRINAGALEHIGWSEMCPDVYAIRYTNDDDGSVWACPGNGDKELTREIVEMIADDYSQTQMDVFYREQGDTVGLTRVVDNEGPT